MWLKEFLDLVWQVFIPHSTLTEDLKESDEKGNMEIYKCNIHYQLRGAFKLVGAAFFI